MLTPYEEMREALKAFADLADTTPIMVGRGENTRDRYPPDSEVYDFSYRITWGMLRKAKAALSRAEPAVEGMCREVLAEELDKCGWRNDAQEVRNGRELNVFLCGMLKAMLRVSRAAGQGRDAT